MDKAAGIATSFGSSVQSGVTKSLTIAAGGITAAGAAFSFAAYEGLSFNNSMEQVRAKLGAFLPDAAAVESTLAMIQERAAKTPFEFNAMANAAAALIPTSKMAGVELETLIETAEVLAASNPAEGLEGAAFALKEAVSGDFTSIIERFNLPRSRLKELREQGVPDLEAVKIAMSELGLSTQLVTNLANTAEGRWSTLYDTFVNLAGKLTEPFFQKFSDGLGSVNDLITQYQPNIDAFVTNTVDKLSAGVEKGSTFLIKAAGGVRSFVSALQSGQGIYTAFSAFLIATFEPKKAIEYLAVLNDQIRPFIDENLVPMYEWLQNNVLKFTEWSDVLLATGVIVAAVVIPSVLALLAPFASLGLAIIGLSIIFSTLRTAWTDNWYGIRDVANEAYNAVLPFFTDFNGQLLKLMEVIQPLEHRITAVLGALLLIGGLYAVPVLIASITAGVVALGGAAAGLWASLMAAGGLLGVLGSIVAFLGGPLTLAIAAIIIVSGLLYVAWSENWWGIQEVTAEATASVLRGWDLVKNGATVLAKTITDKVDELALAWENKDWQTLAYNVVNFLSLGMLSGLPMMVDAATKLAQAVWDTITGYFTGAGETAGNGASGSFGGEGSGSGSNKTNKGGSNSSNAGASSAGDFRGQSVPAIQTSGAGFSGMGNGQNPINVYIQAPIYGVNQLEETIKRIVNDAARQSAQRKRT
jgi:hypothetical protein